MALKPLNLLPPSALSLHSESTQSGKEKKQLPAVQAFIPQQDQQTSHELSTPSKILNWFMIRNNEIQQKLNLPDPSETLSSSAKTSTPFVQGLKGAFQQLRYEIYQSAISHRSFLYYIGLTEHPGGEISFKRYKETSWKNISLLSQRAAGSMIKGVTGSVNFISGGKLNSPFSKINQMLGSDFFPIVSMSASQSAEQQGGRIVKWIFNLLSLFRTARTVSAIRNGLPPPSRPATDLAALGATKKPAALPPYAGNPEETALFPRFSLEELGLDQQAPEHNNTDYSLSLSSDPTPPPQNIVEGYAFEYPPPVDGVTGAIPLPPEVPPSTVSLPDPLHPLGHPLSETGFVRLLDSLVGDGLEDLGKNNHPTPTAPPPLSDPE